MADQHQGLPPGFKPWPPEDLVKEIKEKWDSQPGRSGQHVAVIVFGTNPLSGYTVVMQPHGPGG
jgi:hypothetical protein